MDDGSHEGSYVAFKAALLASAWRVHPSESGERVASLTKAAVDAMEADDFGRAVDLFAQACPTSSPDDPVAVAFMYSLKLCAVPFLVAAKANGYGEKLIEWFDKNEGPRRSEAYRPLYIAAVALVRGDRYLSNFEPISRGVAEVILGWAHASENQRTERESLYPSNRRS